MNLVDLILTNRLDEAKQLVFDKINSISNKRLEECKKSIPEIMFDVSEEYLSEANVIKMGRIKKIRRRIRRNAKGKIVVQRNIKRSAVAGYRVSGNTVKRIPAIQRIQKTRKLKQYWKTKGKSKLRRTLMKRKQSLIRRKSMGIK
jgi:hypothetical protein